MMEAVPGVKVILKAILCCHGSFVGLSERIYVSFMTCKDREDDGSSVKDSNKDLPDGEADDDDATAAWSSLRGSSSVTVWSFLWD